MEFIAINFKTLTVTNQANQELSFVPVHFQWEKRYFEKPFWDYLADNFNKLQFNSEKKCEFKNYWAYIFKKAFPNADWQKLENIKGIKVQMDKYENDLADYKGDCEIELREGLSIKLFGYKSYSGINKYHTGGILFSVIRK